MEGGKRGRYFIDLAICGCFSLFLAVDSASKRETKDHIQRERGGHESLEMGCRSEQNKSEHRICSHTSTQPVSYDANGYHSLTRVTGRIVTQPTWKNCSTGTRRWPHPHVRSLKRRQKEILCVMVERGQKFARRQKFSKRNPQEMKEYPKIDFRKRFFQKEEPRQQERGVSEVK